MVTAWLLLAVAFAAHADVPPLQVDGAIARGVVALIRQGNAVTLHDLSSALHVNLRWYRRADDRETYRRREGIGHRPDAPMPYFVLSDVVSSPVPPPFPLPGPPARPTQSIRILFDRDRCLSVRVLEVGTRAKFKAFRVPVMSDVSHMGNRARLVLTGADASRSKEAWSYGARIAGGPHHGKTQAMLTLVGLEGECSQQSTPTRLLIGP